MPNHTEMKFTGNTIDVIDMHTAGEPVRIIDAKSLPLKGATILEKRRYAHEHCDHIRRRLMLEPRGHREMYGAILTPPSDPRAAQGVLFTHNSGYSTMCGHATIALGRYLTDCAAVPTGPEGTTFQLETPCGLVSVSVDKTGSVSFQSVPSYADRLDAQVDISNLGKLTFDIGYGGAFYAIFPAARIGMSLAETPLGELHRAAVEIVVQLRQNLSICHPAEKDLSFLYGAIITDDGLETPAVPTQNLCIFGEGQVDRSPTGSGVSARIAVAVERGQLNIGDQREFAGQSGERFTGCAVRKTPDGVIVEVKGKAYYTGRSTFIAESDDPFRDGFFAEL